MFFDIFQPSLYAMKLTSAIIFTLIGVVLVSSKKLDKKLARKVQYYTTLLENTKMLSKTILKTKQLLVSKYLFLKYE